MTDTSDPRVCPTPDLDNGREPKHPKHPKRDPRCPPCDPPPLCELDCLVRPEFHCGQELTEDDLNALVRWTDRRLARSEEHTSELQSLMRISYAVFCLQN